VTTFRKIDFLNPY